MNYRNKIENLYCRGDLRAAWTGVKSMASINQYSCETKQVIHVNGVDNADLTNGFNSCYL